MTSASDPGGFVYKKETPIGEAWTHRYPIFILGGPTDKYVYSTANAKAKGTYAHRQYAGLTLVGGSNAYAYTKIT